jgi:hypothetical protein
MRVLAAGNATPWLVHQIIDIVRLFRERPSGDPNVVQLRIHQGPWLLKDLTVDFDFALSDPAFRFSS